VGYNYRDPENRTKAAAMLTHLKGQLVDVTGVTVEALSERYALAEAHWQLSKATGVHVYQDAGGWHADLEFDDLPKGIPELIGTLEPVPTQAEAIESVVGMMSICAQRDAVPAPSPTGGLRWFRFDEQEIPVDPGMLESYVARVPDVDFGKEDILHELDLLRVEIAGDGPVTQVAWAAADFQVRYDACRMCCTAMAFGIMRIGYDPTLHDHRTVEPVTPSMH
jgi:hypothetical protein